MTYCHNYLPAVHFSMFALDPDTPETDYEIHLIKTSNPAYIPPDNEAWPLYYQVILDALQAFPGAYEAVQTGVTAFCRKIQGRRALLPQPPNSARHPNEANPLAILPDLGSRSC